MESIFDFFNAPVPQQLIDNSVPDQPNEQDDQLNDESVFG